MKLTHAEKLAVKVIETMRPYCDRIEVAGTIRRRHAEVRELDLVAIPTLGDPVDLLGEERENLLCQWARLLQAEERILWLKPNVEGVIRWPLDEKSPRWRGLLVKSDTVLRVHLAQSGTWGVCFFLATGSPSYTHQVVSDAPYKSGHHCIDNWLINREGAKVQTPEEADVFEALGLPFVPPEARD